MNCCNAPPNATTTEENVSINMGKKKEMVATDVRGLLFPTVHKYEEVESIVCDHRIKVIHIWKEGG